MAHRLARPSVMFTMAKLAMAHLLSTYYGSTYYGSTYYGSAYCGSTYCGSPHYVKVMRDCKPGMLEYQLEARNHSKCSV